MTDERGRFRVTWSLAVLLVLAACDDPSGPDGGSWDFTSGTDNISGEPWAQAKVQASLTGAELFVRCREGAFDVLVTTGFVTASGAVRYRLDSSPMRSETWSEATNFQGLFYPGDAVAFAQQLAEADEMVFEAREFGGTAEQSTFHIEGLAGVLPRIEGACA